MKKLFALGAACALALGLASCGEKKEGGSNVIKLEYSGTASNKEFNESLFEAFKADRKAKGDPNTYEISYVEHGPDLVDSEVKDWEVGPDVFEFASDKITSLYEKGALAKVTGANADFVTENNSEISVGLATFNGDIYAYPYTGDNTYYLHYDKSILTEDDVKSMERILEVANEEGKMVGYTLKTPFWGGGALFTFGADYDMTFNADGAVEKIEANFNTEAGLKAAKAILKIVNDPAWQNTATPPTPKNNLIACIDGTWETSKYKKELGDNYACAPMPTVTVDGDTKNLGAFLGGKLFGVNPQRSQGDVNRLVAAHQLAIFLSNKESQLARFDDQNVAPCNIDASNESKVVNDINIKCLYEQAKFAHPQTATPPKFWTAPETLIVGMCDGTITEDNLVEALETLNATIVDSK
ncbi:MAG: extracellular solute-binding protein [Anaeroplasmataceae bacterium]|nr:extracellular solute-binding protein [Anaeroplasmataceae bacterium]